MLVGTRGELGGRQGHLQRRHLDAWYDKNGAEIGDKCNFVYQGCVPLSTGSWQIRSLWSNASNGCAQQ